MKNDVDESKEERTEFDKKNHKEHVTYCNIENSRYHLIPRHIDVLQFPSELPG